MASIVNFAVGSDETKRLRIFNGSATTITKAEFEACLGTTLVINAFNAAGEKIGLGDAFEACSDYPGGIYVRVSGSSISRQPQPISYAIARNNNVLVIGEVNSTGDGGDGDSGGGVGGESPPSDPNFGGEPPIDSPDIADPPGSPPALPSGNGNKGFTTSTGGGSETGITGGNA